MPTVCAQCRHVYLPDKNTPWFRWLCMAAPLPQVFNPVTGETVADPPYKLCRYLNDGGCEAFQAGANQLHPKEAADGNA